MTTRVQPHSAGAQGNLWQPGGAGWRARIGVLTPHFDGVLESECWTMAPPGVAIYAARVPFVDASAFAQPPHVDTAAELLAAVPLHAIIYAFTSSSYLLGTEADTALKARLEQRTRGIPVVIPAVAALEAAKLPHEIKIEPGAGHAFFNEAKPDRFNATAAADAYARVLDWFGRYLS